MAIPKISDSRRSRKTAPWRSMPEYLTWRGIIARCHNQSNSGYRNYGAKGTLVCERWRNSFELFQADMGSRPTLRHTIERIDNSKGYEPENCRWATWIEQARNKKNNVKISCRGETKTAGEWSEITGVPSCTILRRFHKGLKPEQILATDLRRPRPCTTKLEANSVRKIRERFERGESAISLGKAFGGATQQYLQHSETGNLE